MEALLKRVLERIVPSREERRETLKLARSLMEELKRICRDVAKPSLVGSLAKGTELAEEKDIDIFLLFSPELREEDVEELGLRFGKELLERFGAKGEVDYAEHPYVKGLLGDVVVEVVPCYDTKPSEAKSAVDRTPHHTSYVLRKLSEKPELCNEIRLLKQFLRGIGCYGAEAKVEGFSGYLAELLVIHYGSFLSTLRAAAGWRFPCFIDPEGLLEGNEKEVMQHFGGAALVVVDPVDKFRNAAAAVSQQRVSELVVAARSFLEKPEASYFFPKRVAPSKAELIERLKERGSEVLAILLEHERLNPNVLYPQLRKTLRLVERACASHDFRVLKSQCWSDEERRSAIILEFEVWQLPNVKKHVGPLVDRDIENQRKFLKKYSELKPYVEGRRWEVDVRREYTHAKELLEALLGQREGFGKHLRSCDARVVGVEELLNLPEPPLQLLGELLLPIRASRGTSGLRGGPQPSAPA